MTYDAEGRLIRYLGSGKDVQHVYDGESRRVKMTGSASGVFVYDASGQLAAEYGTTAVLGRQNLTVDHLGTTRMVTDSNGAVLERRTTRLLEKSYWPQAVISRLDLCRGVRGVMSPGI